MPEFATAQDAMGFVVDQTYRINAEVMSIEYPEYDYASLVPVNAEGPKWASGIYTFVTDSAGQARWYAGGADDMPTADVKQLKTEASFWKKEWTAEGPRWVEARSTDDSAAARWSQQQ